MYAVMSDSIVCWSVLMFRFGMKTNCVSPK